MCISTTLQRLIAEADGRSAGSTGVESDYYDDLSARLAAALDVAVIAEAETAEREAIADDADAGAAQPEYAGYANAAGIYGGH